MHPIAMSTLFALQVFHVLFLALHDWIPLGRLNDTEAVRAANPFHKLVAGTLISVPPFVIGLGASAIYFGRTYPGWLIWWLWISYGLLFIGELEAWWIPYLFHRRTTRASRATGNVRGNERFPARTQRHPAEHAAHNPSHGDAHHIGAPWRTHRTARVA